MSVVHFLFLGSTNTMTMPHKQKCVWQTVVSKSFIFCQIGSYMVTPLMGADLNNIFKTQRLSDDHVQFLVYQILRGLKVS